MKKTFQILTCLFVAGILTTSGYRLAGNSDSNTVATRVTSAVGDPDILREKYEAWKAEVLKQDSSHLTLTLVPQNTHSKSVPLGRISIDVNTATLSAFIENIDTDRKLGLWMAQNAVLLSPDEQNSSKRFIGQFRVEDKKYLLESDITRILHEGYKIDQLIVAPVDTNPLQTVILAASPNLFQRLLAAEQVINKPGMSENTSMVFNAIFPAAQAFVHTGFPFVFNDLVTFGEHLFFNETFNGNGRTCGSCHSHVNNFTIDKEFIATLPPYDPLFVAEFNPFLIFGHPWNLDSQGNPQRFENPVLMREFGLIVENVDGTGDLENRFTMRSTPHNIGMTVSLTPPPNGLTPPDDRTGWGGDGAPSGIVGGVPVSGRIRDFAMGAINQHFPKTLNRSFNGPYPDFRAATTAELDAIEAFMLSLGRLTELQLDQGEPDELILADAGAENGKRLFRDGPDASPGFTCNSCHNNAGANTGGVNRNFDTGVEEFLVNRLNDPDFTVVGQPRPVDGGFGTNPDGDFTSLEEQPGFVNENFGDGTFNNVSLVEAADTAPFFHNNIAFTVEESIEFYQSQEFVDTGRPAIAFTPTEVDDVAAFLRAINAIDNIENSALRQTPRAKIAALNPPPYGPNLVLFKILDVIKAETNDAIEVLEDSNLHGGPFDAVSKLYSAVYYINLAYNGGYWTHFYIDQAEANLEAALAKIRVNG